jgi:hypothetical protein
MRKRFGTRGVVNGIGGSIERTIGNRRRLLGVLPVVLLETEQRLFKAVESGN